MANFYGDVVFDSGKYTDRQTGEEKKRWMKMGAAFQNDDGSLTLKIDAFPASRDWSGWVKIFAKKDDKVADPNAQNYGDDWKVREALGGSF